MNTKPDNIPALPEGAVYLGMGQEFKTCSICFSGWSLDVEKHGVWVDAESWEGIDNDLHYAAPRDSEVARLNGFEAESPCHSENPCAMPDLDEEELELMRQQAEVMGSEIEIVRLRKELTDTKHRLSGEQVARECVLAQGAKEIAELKLRLSEAVRLGDALASSASSVCCVNGPDDYRLSVKRLAAWEAFKASSLKG